MRALSSRASKTVTTANMSPTYPSPLHSTNRQQSKMDRRRGLSTGGNDSYEGCVSKAER